MKSKYLLVASVALLGYLMYNRTPAPPKNLQSTDSRKRSTRHDVSGCWKSGRIHAPTNQIGQTLRYWNGLQAGAYIFH